MICQMMLRTRAFTRVVRQRPALAALTRALHSTPPALAKVSPAELTKILSDRISNFAEHQSVEEVGRVLSVADGIARIYGLMTVKAGEMVEFSSGLKGMALNLETDNVGVVIFGDDVLVGLFEVFGQDDVPVCAHCKHSGFLTNGRDIGARDLIRSCHKVLEVNLVAQVHLARDR